MVRAVAMLAVAVLISGCLPQELAAPTVPQTVAEAPIPQEQVEQGNQRFPIEDGGLTGYVDRQGSVVVPPRFESGGFFSEGLARVREGDLWGYIRPDGSFAITPRYLEASDFSAGRARVVLLEARPHLGTRQAIPQDRRFQSFITPSGEPIVEPVLVDARHFAVVGERALAPAVRTIERRLLPLGAEFLSFLAPTLQAREGWFVLDDSGREVFAVDAAERVLGFSEGLAAFQRRPGFLQQRAPWGYVDGDGRVVIEPRFASAGSFSEGLAAVAEGDRFGFIDPQGRFAIDPRFEQVGPFSDGLARVRMDGLWGYVDPAGRVAIDPNYETATDFAEGLAVVSRGGRFGFIDRLGEPTIGFEFDYARPFHHGLAWVRSGQRRGYIDAQGAFVWSTDSPSSHPPSSP